jgi:RNA polymerase sigma-70 factor, ECF subfamily
VSACQEGCGARAGIGDACPSDGWLVQLACAEDDWAFGELARAHRAELRAHCYRLTRSVADADDAVQEGLLRAWRGLAGYSGRGSVRSWLYAIVTNAALDLTRLQSRREVPVALGSAAGLDSRLPAKLWMDSCQGDRLTGEALLAPEARYEQRESVELAFLGAVQYLPPLQRAALLLREVVGLTTAEIAAQLGTTAAAVNSALQRARAGLRRRLPGESQQEILRTLGNQATRAQVRRYADAFERGDMGTIMAMLTADAVDARHGTA